MYCFLFQNFKDVTSLSSGLTFLNEKPACVCSIFRPRVFLWQIVRFGYSAPGVHFLQVSVRCLLSFGLCGLIIFIEFGQFQVTSPNMFSAPHHDMGVSVDLCISLSLSLYLENSSF